MSYSYGELITLVRDWANRDDDVLPNRIIGDALQWGVDKAYRTLRIPPLENTITYGDLTLAEDPDLVAATSTRQNLRSQTELRIPGDLIEFIYLRGLSEDGATTRLFNEKTDIRTFYDQYAEKTNDFAYWARHGNNMLLTPGYGRGVGYGALGGGTERGYELHYYRRLPALYARYDNTLANVQGGTAGFYVDNPLTTPEIPTNAVAVPNTREMAPTRELWRRTDEDGMITFSVPGEGTRPLGTDIIRAYGLPVDNWFKDENQRIALYGALAQCFAYLQDDDQSGKYLQLFTSEIQELNDEDRQRTASGGNVQVNFNGRGLI